MAGSHGSGGFLGEDSGQARGPDALRCASCETAAAAAGIRASSTPRNIEDRLHSANVCPDEQQLLRGKPRPTVKGPYPAVCLTEQPISAILITLEAEPGRYSGYGIGYYKPNLFDYGGLPVLYSSKAELGKRIKEGEPGWEEGKDIFGDGLPLHLQYLWVNYDPLGIGPFNQTLDFTWEREWRVKFPNPRIKEPGLPVGLRNPWSEQQGAIFRLRESEIEEVQACIKLHREQQTEWAQYITRVISLETAKRHLAQGTEGMQGWKPGRTGDAWPNPRLQPTGAAHGSSVYNVCPAAPAAELVVSVIYHPAT